MTIRDLKKIDLYAILRIRVKVKGKIYECNVTDVEIAKIGDTGIKAAILYNKEDINE